MFQEFMLSGVCCLGKECFRISCGPINLSIQNLKIKQVSNKFIVTNKDTFYFCQADYLSIKNELKSFKCWKEFS